MHLFNIGTTCKITFSGFNNKLYGKKVKITDGPDSHNNYWVTLLSRERFDSSTPGTLRNNNMELACSARYLQPIIKKEPKQFPVVEWCKTHYK